MKIQFEVELTPEELRRLCGLPDISKMQDMMIEQMGEKIKQADMETMKNMMKPFVFDGVKAGAESYQQFVTGILKMATMGKVDLSVAGKQEESEPDNPARTKSSRTGKSRK